MTPSAGLATPVHLRSCCVLGNEIQRGTSDPWPGFESGNVRDAGDLGPHEYDSGSVALAGDGRGGAAEKNGLVYTCRGGFVDVGAARDSADMTAFLAAAIEPRLESGGPIALADDGGTRYVIVHAVDAHRLEVLGRHAVAVDVAGWTAYQIAVWRQIAQWYGDGWGGRAAAFSPEDGYSSLLGIEVAQQILARGEGATAPSFAGAMTAELPAALDKLDALPAAGTRAATKAVDGLWWDSSRAAPDPALLLRRRFDVRGDLTPWLVCQAYAGRRCPFRECSKTAAARLSNPSARGDLAFAAVATLEIEVDGTLAARGFPFPRDDSDIVTQDNFDPIVAAIRAEAEKDAAARRRHR